MLSGSGLKLNHGSGALKYVFGADHQATVNADSLAEYGMSEQGISAALKFGLAGSSTGTYVLDSTSLKIEAPGTLEMTFSVEVSGVANVAGMNQVMPATQVPIAGEYTYTCSGNALTLRGSGVLGNLTLKRTN